MQGHLSSRAVDGIHADLVVEAAVDVGRAVVKTHRVRGCQLFGVRVRAIAPLYRGTSLIRTPPPLGSP